MTVDSLSHSAADAGHPLSDEERRIVQRVAGGETFDLEKLLADLSTAVRFTGSSYAQRERNEDGRDRFVEIRRKANRALAASCDLANDPDTLANDLAAHTLFFSRLLATRRSDLERIRLFTTNYDLVIEKALDTAGVDYCDGFVGTIDRILRMDVYAREYYTTSSVDRRPRRLADFYYLYKMHGSINWRSRPDHRKSGSDRVIQVADYKSTNLDDLALIYPTPQKEEDTLGYPYSDLLRAFGSTLGEPDTALLAIGYGFADDHINRIILQSLASNPTLAIIVIDPFGILELKANVAEFIDTPAGRFVAAADARISCITGQRCRFGLLAETFLPSIDLDDYGTTDAAGETV